MTQLLVTEHNQVLRDRLADFLAAEGYQIKVAGDEASALQLACEHRPQVVLLNVNDACESSEQLYACMRADGARPSVWMAAGRAPGDNGFGHASAAERSQPNDAMQQPEAYPRLLMSGDLVLDLLARRVVCAGQTLSLTPKEFQLLVEFVQHRGVLLSRAQLFELVWGGQYAGNRRTLDVHISWLRKKIERYPERPQRITTVRNLGYRFEN